MSKIFAIGDIHGYYNKFIQILNKINYNPDNDLLILLGDYIDRGNFSYEVVQKVKELVSNGAVALRGNHEQFALSKTNTTVRDCYSSNREAYEIWMYNGGLVAIESYHRNNAFIEDDIEFFQSLPLVYETDDFIFVHAGLKPGKPLYQQISEDMLWIREDFINSNYDWGKTVVFGHTPMKDIYYGYKKIGIDTGCFHTGILSCVELTSGTVYQTDKK